MLLEVSSSKPTRSGRSVWRLKNRMRCGCPSSVTRKSLSFSVETILFCLSNTVKSTSTRLTSRRMVSGDAGGVLRLRRGRLGAWQSARQAHSSDQNNTSRRA